VSKYKEDPFLTAAGNDQHDHVSIARRHTNALDRENVGRNLAGRG